MGQLGLDLYIVIQVKLACAITVFEGEAWPVVGVFAGSSLVPAGAALGPDGALHAFLHLLIEDILNVSAQVQIP